jgi:hypothetical protein
MPNSQQPDLDTNTQPPGKTATSPEPTQEEIPAETSTETRTRSGPAIIAGIVAVVVLAALILIGVLLFNNPPVAAVLRDIFIILLGIQTMIIGLLMVVAVVAIIYVALKMYDLVQFVENELRPMLQRADDAMRTVQSRTVFISDAAVKPVIEVMSYTSAVKSIFKSFTRRRD